MEGYFFFTARLTFVFSAGVPNCDTRDKAFLACASFSIGYFLLSGSAKDFVGSFFRAVLDSFAILTALRMLMMLLRIDQFTVLKFTTLSQMPACA